VIASYREAGRGGDCRRGVGGRGGVWEGMGAQVEGNASGGGVGELVEAEARYKDVFDGGEGFERWK